MTDEAMRLQGCDVIVSAAQIQYTKNQEAKSMGSAGFADDALSAAEEG
jgi:hypothetical protein